MGDIPLIIDDVSAAGAHLTGLGQEVVGPACEAVRAAIREFARSRGWVVTTHDSFSRWVQPLVPSGKDTLCLDPLLRVRSNAQDFRVSRVLDAGAWRLAFDNADTVDELVAGRCLTLVDDAVASGSTLGHFGSFVEDRGGRIGRIIVCASTSRARAALSERFPGAEWLQFVDRGCYTIHLRDACPYAPFSGRPHASHPPIQTKSGTVPVRIPSITIRQSLWGRVFSDYRVLAATVRARSEVCVRLSAALEREATVADLPLLGDNIALPAYPRQYLTAGTPLASIC